jgi:hypothetical protein
VIRAPAVAPEAPKQATVATLGYFPIVFAWTRGSTPKFRLIHAAYVYLDFWYADIEMVRTRVMLATGAVTPIKSSQSPPRIIS